MSLTPQEIQAKEFREAFRGYHQDDVDGFLDEVAEEQGRVLQENQRLRIQAAALQQEVARLRESHGIDVSDEIRGAREEAKDEVKEDARRALVAAQNAAEAVLQEARAKADEIVAEAEGRSAEIVARTAVGVQALDPAMATTIEDLQEGIGDLRRKEAEIRDRVRAMLEEQIRIVDQSEAQAHHAATVNKIAEALGEGPPEPDPQRFWAEPATPPGGGATAG